MSKAKADAKLRAKLSDSLWTLVSDVGSSSLASDAVPKFSAKFTGLSARRQALPRRHSPPGGSRKPISTTKHIWKLGFSINPDDYDPATNADAPANVASLCDDIPMIGETWESSGSRVSFQWWTLLSTGRAAIPHDTETEEAEEARKKLYKDYDTLTKSSFYKALDHAFEEVQHKGEELVSKLQKQIRRLQGPEPTQAKYEELYEKLSPPYLAALETAQQQYLVRQMEVERYMSILYRSSTGTVSTLLMNMTTKMFNFKRLSMNGGQYYEVTMTPTDWWTWFKPNSDDDDEGWTSVTVNQNGTDTPPAADGETSTEDHESFPFLRVESDEKEETQVSSEDSKDVVISFKARTVAINRPWLEKSILYYKDIRLPSAQSGQWSTGVMNKRNMGSFPLLPTTFIVAKDITVRATQFSKEAEDTFDKLHSSFGAKWQLFYFSGGGDSSSGSSTVSWNKTEQCVSVSGVQLIGGFCTLIPYFPQHH